LEEDEEKKKCLSTKQFEYIRRYKKSLEEIEIMKCSEGASALAADY
jgi:hypothetical protein